MQPGNSKMSAYAVDEAAIIMHAWVGVLICGYIGSYPDTQLAVGAEHVIVSLQLFISITDAEWM